MNKKIFRIFIIAILSLGIAFAFSSCGLDINSLLGNDTDEEVEHKAEVDTTRFLPITSDSKAVITVVSSYSKEREYAEAFNSLMSKFKNAGIDFTYAYSASADKDVPEILIGDKISASGDYYVDPHDLGDDGYVVRVQDNKVIIAGGSTEALVKAIEVFDSKILCLDDPVTDIGNIAIPRSANITILSYSPIKSVRAGSYDLRTYDIITDTSNEELKHCADTL